MNYRFGLTHLKDIDQVVNAFSNTVIDKVMCVPEHLSVYVADTLYSYINSFLISISLPMRMLIIV